MSCIRSERTRRTIRHRWVPALTALVALSWACGDQGPSAPRPASIEVVSTQLEGPPGQALSAPLIVRVLDAGGGPVPGVEVAFSTTGGGSFSPPTVTTGTDGRAQTIWTLGSAAGQQTATVTVGTVTAQAIATAADPCDRVEQYTIGTEVNATLTSASCRVADAFYTDRYRFTLAQATAIRIDQSSQAFDTYLELFNATTTDFVGFGVPLAPNSPDRSIRITLNPGTYELWASTFDEDVTGTYRLNSQIIDDPYADCFPAFIALGVTTTQPLVHACTTTISGVSHPGYATYFLLPAGVGRTVTQSAAAVASTMKVFQYIPQAGNYVLLHEGSSAPGTPATFNLPSGVGLYLVVSNAGAPGETPTFTLGVQ